MPKTRYSQVSLAETPYYHCVSRCVRRAFLFGTDQLSGLCYEHRRQRVQDKALEISDVIAINRIGGHFISPCGCFLIPPYPLVVSLGLHGLLCLEFSNNSIFDSFGLNL